MNRKKLPLVLLFCALLAAGPLMTFLLPQKAFSEKEKRYLETAPALNLDTLLDGSFTGDTEAYLADHFPAREQLVGLSAYFDLFTGRNGSRGIYIAEDNWLFPKPVTPDPDAYQKNLDALRSFAEKSGLPATLLAVPTAGGVSPGLLPQNHEPYNDAALLDSARDALAGAADWVDLTGLFSARQEDGLYYRTDHHWTSRGAYLAYAALMEGRGTAPLPPSAFTVTEYEGFRGTSYAKSGYLAVPSEPIELWENPALHVSVTVRDDNQAEAVQSDSPFFLEHLTEPDMYPVFLNGNHSRVRIENPDADGGRLLVIKDSFAHCLAPFLAAHYSRIDLLDLRYFKKQTVTEYMEENPCDEILFVYGLDSLATDKTLRWLS